MKKQIAVAVTFLSMLLGCAAAPTIRLVPVTSSADLDGSEVDTFSLAKSRLIITNTTPDGTTGVAAISVASVPIDSGKKFAVRIIEKFGVKTNLNLTKIENTPLVSQVGSEVTDNRVEWIQQAGSVITKLVPLGAAQEPTQDLQPEMLPLTHDNLFGASDRIVLIPNTLVATLGPLPPDARPLDDIQGLGESRNFVYSACRTLSLDYRIKGRSQKTEIMVSDPRYFQTVALPVKGTVRMHSQCGVSVSTDKNDGVSSNLALVGAIIEQAKAIAAATEEKKQK